MQPYGFRIGPFASLSIPMSPNVSLYIYFCFFIGLYKSLSVLMDFDWSLWDIIGPYASLISLMVAYGSLCVLMFPYGF